MAFSPFASLWEECTDCVAGISQPSCSVEHVPLLKLGSWQSLARGTVLMSLPPTVEFSVAHESSEGQQLSPGKHLHEAPLELTDTETPADRLSPTDTDALMLSEWATATSPEEANDSRILASNIEKSGCSIRHGTNIVASG